MWSGSARLLEITSFRDLAYASELVVGAKGSRYRADRTSWSTL